MSASPPRLDDQLCFAVHAAARSIVKAYGPFLRALDLTYPQYLVMMVLWEGDGLSVGQLGARLLLDSGTLTPLLKRMERRGLVARQRDPTDERRVCIHLSPGGRALGQVAAQRYEELLCHWSAADRRDLQQLRDSLHALTRSLRDRADPVGAGTHVAAGGLAK